MLTDKVYKTDDVSTTPNGDSNGKQRQFVKIYSDILSEYGAKLKPLGIAVYTYLCMRADSKTRKCWPSFEKIAKDLGVSRNTAKKGVSLVEKAGLIRVDPYRKDNGSCGSNVYTILEVPKGVGQNLKEGVGEGLKDPPSNVDPELEPIELEPVFNQCVRDTESVIETEPHPRTEGNNFSSTGSAFGSAGDREQRHEENGSGEFVSSRSSESQKAPPRPPSPWAESALEVFEDRLEELDLTAPQPWEREQFLRKFEELRTEQEIDNETAFAVIRRMLDQWKRIHLSPDHAYQDVTEKYPQRYPPMDRGELFEWVDGYREKLEREEDGGELDDYADIPFGEDDVERIKQIRGVHDFGYRPDTEDYDDFENVPF